MNEQVKALLFLALVAQGKQRRTNTCSVCCVLIIILITLLTTPGLIVGTTGGDPAGAAACPLAGGGGGKYFLDPAEGVACGAGAFGAFLGTCTGALALPAVLPSWVPDNDYQNGAAFPGPYTGGCCPNHTVAVGQTAITTNDNLPGGLRPFCAVPRAKLNDSLPDAASRTQCTPRTGSQNQTACPYDSSAGGPPVCCSNIGSACPAAGDGLGPDNPGCCPFGHKCVYNNNNPDYCSVGCLPIDAETTTPNPANATPQSGSLATTGGLASPQDPAPWGAAAQLSSRYQPSSARTTARVVYPASAASDPGLRALFKGVEMSKMAASGLEFEPLSSIAPGPGGGSDVAAAVYAAQLTVQARSGPGSLLNTSCCYSDDSGSSYCQGQCPQSNYGDNYRFDCGWYAGAVQPGDSQQKSAAELEQFVRGRFPDAGVGPAPAGAAGAGAVDLASLRVPLSLYFYGATAGGGDSNSDSSWRYTRLYDADSGTGGPGQDQLDNCQSYSAQAITVASGGGEPRPSSTPFCANGPPPWTVAGRKLPLLVGAVTNALAAAATGHPNASISSRLRQLPGVCFGVDVPLSAVGQQLFLFPLGTSFTMPLLVMKLASEKSLGLKRLMVTGGLRAEAYWLGSYLFGFLAFAGTFALFLGAGAGAGITTVTNTGAGVWVALALCWSHALCGTSFALSGAFGSAPKLATASAYMFVAAVVIASSIVSQLGLGGVADSPGLLLLPPVAYVVLCSNLLQVS